jgi:ribonuclease E
MSKEIYISSTPHETRLAIVENDALTEIYYERENEYTLAGSIYNGKVTRVLPGMQSSFVDIGLERDAFLYITDFMEEAGDSADFEASANAGDSRAVRSEGGRSEGNRGETQRKDRGNDRGTRSEPRETQPRALEQSRPAEPTDAELFTDAVAGLEAARPSQDSERSGRGRRGRGRDRHRGGAENAARQGSQTSPPEAPAAQEAEPEHSHESTILGHPTSVETEALGEGAPGADGSRRWRGRRGRRGRGGERPQATDAADQNSADATTGEPAREDVTRQAEMPVAETPRNQASREQLPPSQTPRLHTGPIENAYGDAPALKDENGADSIHLEASASGDTSVGREAGRNRGGRGDRNRRDRSAPRGFTPSSGLHHADGSEALPYGQDAESNSAIEPMILPGESLSKYRPGREATAVEPTQSVPAVDSYVAAGWDGGLALPGETIRPRGPVSDARTASRDDRPFRNDRPGRDDRSRDRQRGRDDGGRNRNDRPTEDRPAGDRPAPEQTAAPEHNSSPKPEIQTYPAVAAKETSIEPHSAEVPTYLSAPETALPSHLITPLDTTMVPPPPVPAQQPAGQMMPVDLHASSEPSSDSAYSTISEPVEYEPIEAAASYRVDPVPPIEYRQASPVLEHPAATEDAPEASHNSDSLRPQAEDAPEFTSIDDVGGMHSEAQSLDPIGSFDLTEPILHQTAVVLPQDNPEPSLSHPDSFSYAEPFLPASPFVPVEAAAPAFAPGDGMLEEEMFEEEDDTEPSRAMPVLHAHSGDTEEETLDGAADLGSMLREMSIDHITRPERVSEHEGDDDFEEDFLEEDQDFDTEEAHTGEDDLNEPAEENTGEQFAHPDELESSEYGGGFEGDRVHKAEGEPNGSAEPQREGGRRDERVRRSGRGDRSRRGSERTGSSSGGSSYSGGSGRRDQRSGGRQSAQLTNLPAISDLLKPGQEILCQIAKEPIAKKGARITSHIALPGRFLVFMPTVSHTGVSRKIESDGERRRLKEILLSEKGDAAGGFIVRTAAAGASEDELRSDLRFLLNLWSDIKTRSESSKSPALIYHDLNLVERVLRDQVTDNFSAIWVDTESQYEQVLRFLQRFQPSLIRRVKLYTKETPLFEQFGITDEINKALRSKVWLKSGGSIVINQTEALVAIDINTGKFVGKTARLEDTIVKTNLDSIPEIVRQIRLRDLGGIIIIDFIDMDERKNRAKVMAALEEELKSDRAPSKVLQFNDFGLVAITRKRVKQSLERTLSTTCGICAGTGMVKSPVTVCNDIYVEMRKMSRHLDRGDVMLRVNPEVVKQLKSSTKWLQEMEEMVGKTILIKSDPSLHPEQFDIH